MLSKLLRTLLLICIPTIAPAQFFEEGHLIRDVRNNLTWLRCSVGQRWDYDSSQCIGQIIELNHDEIPDAIRQANQQLGGSWRLPSVEELESLVCKECEPPKVRQKYFTNIDRDAYWTGTQNYFNSRMYWSVNFMTGHSYSRFLAYQQLPVLLVSDR